VNSKIISSLQFPLQKALSSIGTIFGNSGEGTCGDHDPVFFRGIYTDSKGAFAYEGMDLYNLLHNMTEGDNGIQMTDTAYKVVLKSSSRLDVAEFTLLANVAYVYVCEEFEPGFKHTAAHSEGFNTSRYRNGFPLF
jgi:hypothetical protein